MPATSSARIAFAPGDQLDGDTGQFATISGPGTGGTPIANLELLKIRAPDGADATAKFLTVALVGTYLDAVTHILILQGTPTGAPLPFLLQPARVLNAQQFGGTRVDFRVPNELHPARVVNAQQFGALTVRNMVVL